MTLRLHGDFDGLFGGLPCLSHGDRSRDEAGNAAMLRAGMAVVAFEDDPRTDGTPDEPFASGTVEPGPDWLQRNGSRRCLKIDGDGVRHRSDAK